VEFFDAPPLEPPPMPPMPPRQDWMGPPEGWLGGYVPLRLELVRAPGTLLLLGPMEGFPTGVRFELQLESREPSHGPGMGPMGPFGEDFRLGVAYADGGKWTGFRFPAGPLEAPPAPNVMFNGGGGGGNHFSQRLWLWPLPPAGPVTFAVSWPSMGVAERTIDIDGEVFRAAAAEAEQLWEPLTPEEQEAHRREAMARMQAMRPGVAGVLRLQATRPDEPDDG
jgi:hypothetical protein